MVYVGFVVFCGVAFISHTDNIDIALTYTKKKYLKAATFKAQSCMHQQQNQRLKRTTQNENNHTVSHMDA